MFLYLHFTFSLIHYKMVTGDNMKNYEIYLFDFDGTLCDTTEGIFNSVIYSLDCFGIRETDGEKLRFFVGPPLFESYKTLYNVSDDDAKWLIEKYRERYREKAAEESSLYDGVTEMLKELKARGKKIAIASSKPKYFVDEIAKYHDIYKYFDFIAAETFANNHSSKQELINTCLDYFGKPDKATVLMTGDRCYDIDGANAVGVDSAGAVFGFGTVEELTTAGATYILNKPEDLLI